MPDREAKDPTQVGRAPAGSDDVASEPTVAASEPQQFAVASQPVTPSATTVKVGDTMRAATVERFGRSASHRFELLGELARGGLGRVSRARDPRTDRIVAIKEVIKPAPETIARFAREALATANLQHPGIVPVYEVGRWPSGEPYYAMKLVQGRTLHELIGTAKTTADRVALLPHVIAVADALAYAHGERVIHRDLKPGNVLVGAYGETVVIDWGLAKNLATGEELDELPHATTIPPDNAETIAGAVLGTPSYMPPEQARGETLDERADVYSIGAILYHVLAGVRPYASARALDELLEAVTTVPPAPLPADIPPELVAIVDKAMARAPDARYPNAAGIADDLRKFQAGKLVAAHRYTTGELVRRWLRRYRAVVITAVAAVAVLVAFAVVSVRQIARERDDATAARDRVATTEALAQRRLDDGLVELARQALVADQADRALALLAEARHPTNARTAELLASEARLTYGGLVGIAPGQMPVVTTGLLSDDGTLLYTVSGIGEARSWSFASAHAVWTVPEIARMELSPDGHTLLAVTVPGAVTLLAADTGRELRRWGDLGSYADRATALAWSPDGTRFAAIAASGRVAFGRTADTAWQELERLAGAAAVAFSPDGRWLAIAGTDGTLVIRDGDTGALVAKLSDGPGALVGLTWIDGDRVAAAGGTTTRIWRISDRRIEHRVDSAEALNGVTAGRDWFATFGDGERVTIWDLATGAPRAFLDGHRIGCDDAGTDGEHLITTDETGDTFVWDPATGERLYAIPPEGAGPAMRVRAGRVVVYGGGRVRVFRFAHTGRLRHVDGHVARIRDLTFSADGTVLWTASNDGTARGYELATGRTRILGTASGSEPALRATGGTMPPANPHGLRSLTLSPDGSRVATASEDGTVALWDATTGAHLADWAGHTTRARKVVFTADGKLAFSVGDTTVRKWDVATGHQLAAVELGGTGWDVALFDNDRAVATVTDARMLAVWRPTDLKEITKSTEPGLRDMVLVGDNVLVATASAVQLTDQTGRLVATASVGVPRLATVADRWLAIATSTEQVVLLGRDLAPIRRWSLQGQATQVRLRPDGAVLAVAAEGGRVSLWDTATGSMLVATAPIPAVVTQLAWSPDGRTLAIAGYSGTVWLWELGSSDPAALTRFAACVSPWKVTDDGVALATREFDPGTCVGVLDRR